VAKGRGSADLVEGAGELAVVEMVVEAACGE
jgi:hypothetical protein